MNLNFIFYYIINFGNKINIKLKKKNLRKRLASSWTWITGQKMRRRDFSLMGDDCFFLISRSSFSFCHWTGRVS